jgi:hypothetical protein
MIEIYSDKQFHQTTPLTIYNIIDYFREVGDEKEAELLKEASNINDVTKKVMNTILSSDSKINWNIFHNVYYNGDNNIDECKYKPDDIKIKKKMDIIGWSDTTVYHMVFKSDFNSLNYWNTMIEILLERFIIYNTSNKGEDVKKFKNKAIKTYLFSLKEKQFHDFNFTIDETNDKKLREELKGVLVKHFSSFNIQLHNYCSFLIKTGKWRDQGYSSPFDCISSKYQKVKYVRDFFVYLHNRRKDDKDYVKKISHDQTLFCDKLNEYIEELCDNMLNLKKIEDDDW